MKRIIFSLYRDDLSAHDSVPTFKKQQFKKYADLLEEKHRKYAKLVGADYILIRPDSTDYIEVQFQKLLTFEKLADDYDELMYIDFDVIPNTNVNIFNNFDLNKVCAFDIQVPSIERKELKTRLKDDFTWHSMDMYTKAHNKKAMLLLHDIVGTQSCINTAVVLMNSRCIRNFNFTQRSIEAIETFNNSLTDNVYPKALSKSWVLNNEVIFSYIIEKYNIPFTNIRMPWNFILDHNEQNMTAAAHFLHFVHKKFDLFFDFR